MRRPHPCSNTSERLTAQHPHEVLRETRGDTRKDAPAVTVVGAELRGIANQLKRVESYTIVARMAVEGACDQVDEVAVLLQRAVGDLLFELIRSLENIAAQCDGGLPSDRNDDDESEDDDEQEGAS